MRFNKDSEPFNQVDMMPLIAKLPTEIRIVDVWNPGTLSFVKQPREFTISSHSTINNVVPIQTSLVAA